MAVESHPIVYISGALGAIVAPLTFLQQTKLTQVEALSQVNEKMDVEVNTLKQENSRLANQVTTLESSVVHLQEMSQTLETIRAVEGQSIDTLEQQLKDSETILGTMQDNLRGNIIQTIITFVFAINRDGDMFLSDDEIGTLIIKIEEMAGGQFDLKDDLLRQKLCENGRSLTAILDLVRNLLDEDTPPEESIFAFIH
jgi:alanyl-tRNA synthetase